MWRCGRTLEFGRTPTGMAPFKAERLMHKSTLWCLIQALDKKARESCTTTHAPEWWEAC